MKKKILLVLSLILILSLAAASPAFAQTDEPPAGDEIPVCSEGELTGTVVATDETTGQVTIMLEDGSLCVSDLDGTDDGTSGETTEDDHIIVALLGTYFENVDLDTIRALLGAKGGNTAPEPLPTCDPANPDVTDCVPPVCDPDDPEATDCLPPCDPVTPEVTECVEPTEDSTEQEANLGFGVLVKLLAISEQYGVPLDQLLDEFLGGAGMGELFATYGTPDIKGLGHVFQLLNDNPGKGKDKSGDGEETTTESSTNNVNGNGNGNGNSNGNGNNGNNGNGKGNGNGNGNGKGNGKKP